MNRFSKTMGAAGIEKLHADLFTYAYSGNGRRVSRMTFPTGAYFGKDYDALGRLTATYLKRQDNVDLNRDAYPLYNARHQITRHTRTDASYVNFGYDNLGQLTSAVGSGGQSTENLGYLYDGGWNLNKRTNNGTPTTFTVNDRNQLTSMGSVTYASDANGNLTTETGGAGRTFTYDDENQLTAVLWGSGNYRTEFTYDGRGRMRVRTEKYYSGGQWSAYDTRYYVYDGMLVIQERNSGNTPTVTYTRGLDLSATLQGAGGIGGLLARSHGYSAGAWSSHNFYQADAGGNVTAMANNHATAAALVANYRYDPFGRVFYQSGTLASANTYRFSSKEWFQSPGLYYYGFRFYDPLTQRWLNRDPLMEDGGINLYNFVRNSPASFVDPFGLMTRAECDALRGRILGKAADLLDDLRRYDPIEDGKGGHPKHGGGLTKPGGHFQEIIERKKGLRDDLARYLKECIKCDDQNGPKGTPIPKSIDDMVSRPIPAPVYPSPSSLVHVPGSNAFWSTVGSGATIVAIGSGLAAAIIAAPEITLPALYYGFAR